MQHLKGDILELAPMYEVNAVVVPVTGFVKKNGMGLMGGISKTIADRFKPEAGLGEALTSSNGGVCVFEDPGGIKLVAFPDRPKGTAMGEKIHPYQLIDNANEEDFIEQAPIPAPDPNVPAWEQTWKQMTLESAGYPEGVIPVARVNVPRWAMKPTMTQLSDSLHQLVALTNTEGWKRVLILRPSHPIPMKKVIAKMETILDNRFALVTLR